MFNLQLMTYVKLTCDQRETIPIVIREQLENILVTKIKRAWKRRTKQRLKNIENSLINGEKVTSKSCIDYMFCNIEISLDNIVCVLHEFFKLYKEYTINPIFLVKLSELVVEKVGNNGHEYFCVINTIINKPYKIIISYEQFKYVFSLFSNDILNKLSIYIINID